MAMERNFRWDWMNDACEYGCACKYVCGERKCEHTGRGGISPFHQVIGSTLLYDLFIALWLFPCPYCLSPFLSSLPFSTLSSSPSHLHSPHYLTASLFPFVIFFMQPYAVQVVNNYLIFAHLFVEGKSLKRKDEKERRGKRCEKRKRKGGQERERE